MTRRTVAAVALIVACGVLAYSNSFTNLFLGLDGKESIRDNPHIRRLWPLSEAMSLPLMWDGPVVVDQTATIAHRPFFSLTLAINYFFGGLDPWGYHLVNIAIHILAALALFGVVRRTLMLQELGEPRVTSVAWAVALIWLVHPLQTESVTYLVQRCESLMGLFLLLTLYCGIRSREVERAWGWELAAVACCALGTASKQTAILAPLLLLLHDYVFARARGGLRWRLYGLIAAPSLLILLTLAGKARENFDVARAIAFALAQPAVILHYLRLTLWPDHLYLYVNSELFDVTSPAAALAPATVLLALLVASVVLLLRRSWLGFLGAWFFVTLAPTSTITPIADKIQEHRMYLPLAALVVLAVIAIDTLLRRLLGADRRLRVAVSSLLLLIVVGALGARTYARNFDYHREFAALHPADVHGDYRILADHYLSRPRLIDLEARRARRALAAPASDARDITFAHFVLALAHMSHEQWRAAQAELEAVLERDEGFAYAHEQLGEVLRERGDLEGAIVHLRRAIELKPDAVYARKELALTLKRNRDPAGAQRELEAALRIDPRFSEGHYELGIMALERGETQPATEFFRRAVEYRRDFPDAQYELGVLLDAQGDTAGAVEHLSEVVRLRPQHVRARVKLARLLAEQGELKRAAEHLEAALRQQPELADAHHELGVVLKGLDREEESASHLRRAADLLRGRLSRHPEEVELHNELGAVLMEQGEIEAAVEEFRAAVAARPQSADSHVQLGMALHERGDLAAATAELEQALRLNEHSADAHYELGIILREQESYDESARHLTRALQLRPGSADIHHELGVVLRERGDLDGAEKQLARELELRPESAAAHLEMGIVLRQRGDLVGASRELERAVELDPDSADAHHELGWLRFLHGDLTGAERELRRALELDPDLEEARERLAEVRQRANQ